MIVEANTRLSKDIIARAATLWVVCNRLKIGAGRLIRLGAPIYHGAVHANRPALGTIRRIPKIRDGILDDARTLGLR